MSRQALEAEYHDLLPRASDLRRAVLHDVSAELNSIANPIIVKFGLDPDSIYLAAYPTHSLHAKGRQSKHGHLLLLNEGLKNLAEEAATLVAASIALPRTWWGSRSLTPVEAVARIRSVIGAANGQGVSAYGQFRPARGMRFELARVMADLALKFVIAHEIAHIALGHFGSRTTAGPLSWEEEFEADNAGFRAWLAIEDRAPLGDVRLAGVTFYLGVQEIAFALARNEPWTMEDGLLTALVIEPSAVHQTRSHPPSAARQYALIEEHRAHWMEPEPALIAAVTILENAAGVGPSSNARRSASWLKRVARQANTSSVRQLRSISAGKGLFKAFDTGLFESLLPAEADRFRAVVCAFAEAYLSANPIYRYPHRRRLGHITLAYSRRNPLDRELQHHLRQAIPGINQLIYAAALENYSLATVQITERIRLNFAQPRSTH